MTSSARSTVLLVALLAMLAGYLWVVELPALRRPPVPRDLPAAPPLLAVPPATVVRIDFDHDGTHLTAVRGATGWGDAEGHPWRGEAVSDLVETLASLRPVMIVDPDPKTPGDYGLGPLAGHLRATGADGGTLLALELGDRNPAWTGLYARIADRPEVVLLGGVLRWELEKVRTSAP